MNPQVIPKTAPKTKNPYLGRIIAAYPNAPPKKTLKSTTSQKKKLPLSGLIKTSFRKSRLKTNPANPLITNNKGTNN
jgi:hypothetical protein